MMDFSRFHEAQFSPSQCIPSQCIPSRFFLWLLCIGFWICFSRAHASDNVIPLFPKKHLNLSYDTAIRLQDSSALKSLDLALKMLSQSPPRNMSLKPLTHPEEDFQVLIEIVNSQDARTKFRWSRDPGLLMNKSPEAQTLLLPGAAPFQGPYIVRIFWDKMIGDVDESEFRMERPDAFVRLTLALARQVYGHVVSLQTQAKEIGKIQGRQFELRKTLFQVESEIRASEAVIEFIDQTLRWHRAQLPAAMIKNLYLARDWEQISLKGWRRGRAQLPDQWAKALGAGVPKSAQVLQFTRIPCRGLTID